MTEIIIVIVFISWYSFSSILSESFGKKYKPGVEWLFFVSMIFTQAIAYIIILKNKFENKSTEPEGVLQSN